MLVKLHPLSVANTVNPINLHTNYNDIENITNYNVTVTEMPSKTIHQ